MAEHQFVGIGAAGVDFHAGVTAFETADGELVGNHAFGGFLGGVGDGHGGVDTAGAAHVEFALGLGVEVEEVVTVKFTLLQAEGAGHAGLFVSGDEGLEGSVLDGFAGEDSHDGGNTHAVVGTEGGVVGIHPLTNDFGFDGVFQEVVLLAGTGLGNHVHVGLQHHGVHVLHAFGGGFAHDDVAHAVDTAGNFVLFSPIDEEIAHNLFVFRGTGAFGQSVEIAPQLFGFKVFNCHSVYWFLC